MPPENAHMEIVEIEPRKFGLKVTFGSQIFDCGTYLNRAAAMLAGKLFIQRKEGELTGQKKRPKGKK